jgi:hypothetical protein
MVEFVDAMVFEIERVRSTTQECNASCSEKRLEPLEPDIGRRMRKQVQTEWWEEKLFVSTSKEELIKPALQ